MNHLCDGNPEHWTQDFASDLFIRLFVWNDYDEEAAYWQLIDRGCPKALADAAWEFWSRGAGA